MTETNYSAMTDEQIDLLVAEKIIGAVPCDHWFLQHWAICYASYKHCGHAACYPRVAPPKYSDTIGYALEIVRKLSDRFGFVLTNRGELWMAQFTSVPPKDGPGAEQRPIFSALSMKASRAICDAGLLAFDQVTHIASCDESERMRASIIVYPPPSAGENWAGKPDEEQPS